ncbi:MAG: ATP-binding protein [Acidimicrobiia bacterium]|nr:ATP-binding protein [Acidimicrobiia bacterium]
MSDRTLLITLRAVILLGVVMTVASAAVLIYLGRVVEDSAVGAVVALAFSALAWVVADAQPRNRYAWLLAGVVPLIAISAAGQAVIAANWPEVTLPIEWGSIPADLPRGAAWANALSIVPSSLGFFGMLTFGLLVFPDGRLPSRGWRWLAYLAGIGWAVNAASTIYEWRPSNPLPVGSDQTAFAAVALYVWLVPLACLASLVVRYRRSEGKVRDQIKWIVWGASMFVISSLLGIVTGFSWVTALGFVALFVALAAAMTKYQLFDANVVISRTVVFVALALFIGAVYVGIVVGVGLLFGSGDEPNVWLGIGATVIIAILFQPVRRRMEKVANRMVYGRRTTPYEVLSAFSQGVAAVDTTMLFRAALSLAEGTTATAASIWVRRDDSLIPVASYPEDTEPEAGQVEAEITHEGENLGLITLTVPPGQPFSPTDQELVEQVASGLGLGLRNLQLTDTLKTRVDELRESRRRIVSVQDKTRQMLERDLHDGAQQRLVALKIKIGISESMARNQGLTDIADVLATVKTETDMTIDSLRTLARGIYPPLLDAEGLGPALTTQLHRQPIPITVQAAGVGRHPREIEATIYFCVLEAVQNAIKHANPQSILVNITETNNHLAFEVRDDGTGFDPDTVARGNGLTNITDRIDAVEGTITINSTPGHGTTVTATIPTQTKVPA